MLENKYNEVAYCIKFHFYTVIAHSEKMNGKVISIIPHVLSLIPVNLFLISLALKVARQS